jgi:hypothetical protein
MNMKKMFVVLFLVLLAIPLGLNIPVVHGTSENITALPMGNSDNMGGTLLALGDEYSYTWIKSSADYVQHLATNKIGQAFGQDVYYVWRAFESFDTSIIPDNAVISSASLSIYVTATHGDYVITLQSGYPDYPHNPLVASDFYTGYYHGDTYTNGGQLDSDDITTDHYEVITLSSNGIGWIKKDGTTRFCLRTWYEILDIEPDGDEYCEYKADFPYHEPVLNVVYTAPTEGEDTYYTTILPSVHGSTDPVNDTYEQTGYGIGVTAIPDSGYYFAYWLWNGMKTAGNNNPEFFLSGADITIEAIFVKVGMCTISVLVPSVGEGYTNPSGGGTYMQEKNTTFTVSANPSYGYVFVDWIINGVDVGNANPYTFLLTQDSYAIQPEFLWKTYTLTIHSAEGGELNIGSGTYTKDFKSVVIINATPNEGYSFVNYVIKGSQFMGDYYEYGLPYLELTIESNLDVTPVFKPIPPPPPTGEIDLNPLGIPLPTLLTVLMVSGVMAFVGFTLMSRFDHGTAGIIGGFEAGLFICAYTEIMPTIWFVFNCVTLSGLTYLWWRR